MSRLAVMRLMAGLASAVGAVRSLPVQYVSAGPSLGTGHFVGHEKDGLGRFCLSDRTWS
jgi:hypothetical protein